jgi:pimeloyl-ACP methyl ester carboxylesterase
LEQVAPDRTFQVPVLLVHGDDDQFVPFGPSARFAAARLPGAAVATVGDVPFEVRSDADLTFVHVPGAGHVRSWNRDPAAYDQVLAQFLAGVAS